MYSLSRLWDKRLRMHKPDLIEIKNEKAHEEKKAALGLVAVETLAKIEDEDLEDEDGAKKSCSSKRR